MNALKMSSIVKRLVIDTEKRCDIYLGRLTTQSINENKIIKQMITDNISVNDGICYTDVHAIIQNENTMLHFE